MPLRSEQSNLNKILVSVIVPTFHRDDSLGLALDSLKKQTHPNIQIIVVDDNADPGWSKKIEDEIAGRSDQNIVYIKNQQHQGAAESRNIGIKAAAGEYITFLDDDDSYLPDKVFAQLSDMVQKQADYGLTDLFLYGENDKLVDRRIRSYLVQTDLTDRDTLIQLHMMYHMTGTDTLMFRGAYLHEIGGFPDLVIGEEFCLMLSAIEHGGTLTYLPGCHVKAYVHYRANHGLSTDPVRKISGEKKLYRIKKTYFGKLDRRSVRYIRMRHYAVLAYTELKMKHYGHFLFYGMTLFFSSPFSAIKMLFSSLHH